MSAERPSERYSRQAMFWAIGPAGQERLRTGSAAVIGCGALGSATVELLARSGVGRITVVDRDFVELSNLQRQVLFDEADAAAGVPKAIAAAQAVKRINSEVAVQPLVADVTPDNVEHIVSEVDVVLDGTDNFETRYLVNDACVKLGVPWIYGGAIGATGMSMTIRPGESPCFRCVFPVSPDPGTMSTCDTAGVLASTVMAVAAIQWTEAIKILVGDREHLNPGLVGFDLWSNDHLVTKSSRAPDCPCCVQKRFAYLEAQVTSRTASLCGRNAIQVSPGHDLKLDLAAMGRRLASAGPVTFSDFLVRFTVGEYELTIFADGRAIVKGTSDKTVARTLYARYVGT